MSFNLEILSPVKKVFQGEVNSVTIPGTSGSFQILTNHAPLISNTKVGKIKLDTGSEVLEFVASRGLFEVKENNAVLLVRSVESVDDLDLERAKRAKGIAEEILKTPNLSSVEKVEALYDLERAINRINFLEKSSK